MNNFICCSTIENSCAKLKAIEFVLYKPGLSNTFYLEDFMMLYHSKYVLSVFSKPQRPMKSPKYVVKYQVLASTINRIHQLIYQFKAVRDKFDMLEAQKG